MRSLLARIFVAYFGATALVVALMVGATAPLIAPEERLTVTRLIGLLLGFAGVVVLTGPAAFAASVFSSR